METINPDKRNYTTISPSAKALLLMKGFTTIPFARRAAELITYPEQFVADYDNEGLAFCMRVAHLEVRYLSIDQSLSDITVKNILELSSGFSFRGLEAVRRSDVHYIDTDLPGIIEKKKELVAGLNDDHTDVKGTLELIPLNALDEKGFTEIVSRFSEGPVAIVNEGLLMYLNTAEKEQLCSIIHKVLKLKGGYWITADIYIKNPPGIGAVKLDDEFQRFLEEHEIEKNKFDSLETAELFFRRCGFVIDKEAEPDYTKAGALPYVLKKAPPELLQGMGKAGKINTTWRLKIADD